MKNEKIVFLGDLHLPNEDIKAVNTIFSFFKEYKPQQVVLLGDLLDFNSISRFDVDPREQIDINYQLAYARNFLDELRRKVGDKCSITLLEGNHCYRLTKWLIRNSKELIGLEDGEEEILTVPYLLHLKDRAVKWIPQSQSLILHDWNIEHGEIASQHAGYTAKRMVERRRMNCLIGHTHRAGIYNHTGFASTLTGIEAGCLIDRNSPAASYAKYPNWQTAIVIGEFIDGHFQMNLVQIKEGGFIFNGRRYQ